MKLLTPVPLLVLTITLGGAACGGSGDDDDDDVNPDGTHHQYVLDEINEAFDDLLAGELARGIILFP